MIAKFDHRRAPLVTAPAHARPPRPVGPPAHEKSPPRTSLPHGSHLSHVEPAEYNRISVQLNTI